MFRFDAGRFTVPDPIRDMCIATWRGLAAPGTAWSGVERTAIAHRARAERLREPTAAGNDLPAAAGEAVRMLAATPATTSQPWVDAVVADIGPQAYVEVIGITARVIAIDTFTRLLGLPPEPFAAPLPGSAVPEPPPAKVRKGKAWLPMTGFPVPPSVLSLVPAEQRATNTTAETLYMTGPQMGDPDIHIDGLHRTQIETVATTVSHRNECFY